jgi:cupin 2 domain-containing protein
MTQAITKENMLSGIPNTIPEEVVSGIIETGSVRIKKIISKGHHSPDDEWYDQSENEWVMVVKGSGVLVFENGETVALTSGEYLNIPAHTRHRVSWTDPEEETIWLAVFYK